METVYSFGAWVKQRRRALHLTQEDLALAINCSVVLVRKIEADARRPSYQVAARLASCLQLPSAVQPAFVRAARAELATDQLPSPQAGIERTRALPTRIPAPPTSLIGRDGDLGQLASLLADPSVRLVTLVGPPGVGKTHLALACAHNVARTFSHGATFVDLAPVQDVALLLPAIALMLGIRSRPGHSLREDLASLLRFRRELLVVDNLEHLLGGAAELEALLAATPGVKLLATSRIALGLADERRYAVTPLELPPDVTAMADGGPMLSDSRRRARLEPLSYPAVALFVERGQAAQAHLQLCAGDFSVIAQIVRYLDGLPLAIELAAARLRFQALSELYTRLAEDTLGALQSGARDLPARQRTLHDAIRWSYVLLSPVEQLRFRQLGVFVGGWTLEAAAQLWQTDLQSAHAMLEQLINHSLVRQQSATHGPARYMLLETLRVFTLDCLEQAGELRAARRAHAELCCAIVERGERGLLGDRQIAWLAEISAELGNIRAALEWSLTPQAEFGERSALGARLILAMFWVWLIQSEYVEAYNWFERAVAVSHQAPPITRAAVLWGAAWYTHLLDENERAIALCGESIILARAANDLTNLGFALIALALPLRKRMEQGPALTALDEARLVFEQLGDSYGQAWVAFLNGLLAMDRADLTRAYAELNHAQARFDRCGDRNGAGWIHYNLGQTSRFLGQNDRAAAHYAECMRVMREYQARGNIFEVSVCLGHLAVERGDYDEARHLYELSMQGLREFGNRRHIADCLDGLANIARAEGRPERAAELLGTADALRSAIGIPVSTAARPGYERSLAATHATLPDDNFARAWKRGAARPWEQVVTGIIGP
jgi:predicted ATPase/transcriptional regulator with XRE-family HTH domain